METVAIRAGGLCSTTVAVAPKPVSRGRRAGPVGRFPVRAWLLYGQTCTKDRYEPLCGIMICTMTNLAEHFRRRHQAQTAPTAERSAAEALASDPGVSPQDFYEELVERPDVRRILTRLAQVEDGRA